MRIVVFVAACTVSAFGAQVALSAQAAKPRLAITSSAPLTLKGRGFKAREQVRLLVASGPQTRQRTLRASATGTFTASFPSVPVDRCSGEVVARAIGARGSSATVKLGALVACPPP